MSACLLLISTDPALAHAVQAAMESANGLLRLDRLDDHNGRLGSQFQPGAVIVDSDARSGIKTVFERIADARRRFPTLPIIAAGNEMSAQQVLAALRAGASDFIDRGAGPEQIRAAITNCLNQAVQPPAGDKADVIGILSSLASELDQDFALNLAVRAARQSPQSAVLYVDLSLPETQAGVALDLTIKFGLCDAVRELGRLDEILLTSALARDSRSGLYVLPLARDSRQNAALEAESFGALLHILRGIFDKIVIGFGPFSRQRALLAMIPDARLFLCCSQRFSAIRGARDMLVWLTDLKCPQPQLVVHEMAPGLVPAPTDICKALNIPRGVTIGGSWDFLTNTFNAGTPPALSANSRYCRALDECLGIGAPSRPEAASGIGATLRGWLNLRLEARPS